MEPVRQDLCAMMQIGAHLGAHQLPRKTFRGSNHRHKPQISTSHDQRLANTTALLRHAYINHLFIKLFKSDIVVLMYECSC
jgi:hypothetical protein